MNAVYSRKVVIADQSEEFREALETSMSRSFRVRSCANGLEALELIRSWEPDVVVMDLALPGLDGVGLLRKLSVLPAPPMVLVTASLLSDFVQFTLEELGVQYAMRKPCSVDTVAARVEELTRRTIPSDALRDRYRNAVCETLRDLGLPHGRQGFQYLLTGLPMLMQRRDQRLSKELYDAIASSCGSSAFGVEKAIRDTIRAGWEAGNPAVWNRYFPGCVHCPRNKEFLFRITDLLMERQRSA